MQSGTLRPVPVGACTERSGALNSSVHNTHCLWFICMSVFKRPALLKSKVTHSTHTHTPTLSVRGSSSSNRTQTRTWRRRRWFLWTTPRRRRLSPCYRSPNRTPHFVVPTANEDSDASGTEKCMSRLCTSSWSHMFVPAWTAIVASRTAARLPSTYALYTIAFVLSRARFLIAFTRSPSVGIWINTTNARIVISLTQSMWILLAPIFRGTVFHPECWLSHVSRFRFISGFFASFPHTTVKHYYFSYNFYYYPLRQWTQARTDVQQMLSWIETRYNWTQAPLHRLPCRNETSEWNRRRRLRHNVALHITVVG